MKLFLDVDGVFANFHEAFRRAANTLYPGRFPEEGLPAPKGWYFLDWGWGFTEDEVSATWEKIKEEENFWTHSLEYRYNMIRLRNFLRLPHGHDVYFLTSRVETAGDSVAKQTRFWLAARNVYAASYEGVLTTPGMPLKKAEILNALGADMFIDDHAETVEAVEKKVEDTRIFLLDRPWNQNYYTRNRVKDLNDFFKLAAPESAIVKTR